MRRPIPTLAFFLLSGWAMFWMFAHAHSNIADERETGDYRVRMSYFGDAAFANTPIDFNVYAYPKQSEETTPVSKGNFSVVTKDNTEIDSGTLSTNETTSHFQIQFPKSGDYIIKISLTIKDRELPNITFPLYVYHNPAQVPAPMPTSTLPEINEPAADTQSPNYFVITGLIVLTLCTGIFLFRGNKGQ